MLLISKIKLFKASSSWLNVRNEGVGEVIGRIRSFAEIVEKSNETKKNIVATPPADNKPTKVKAIKKTKKKDFVPVNPFDAIGKKCFIYKKKKNN